MSKDKNDDRGPDKKRNDEPNEEKRLPGEEDPRLPAEPEIEDPSEPNDDLVRQMSHGDGTNAGSGGDDTSGVVGFADQPDAKDRTDVEGGLIRDEGR